MWKCNKCTLLNRENSTRCDACFAARQFHNGRMYVVKDTHSICSNESKMNESKMNDMKDDMNAIQPAKFEEWQQFMFDKCKENRVNKRKELKTAEYAHGMTNEELICLGMFAKEVKNAHSVGNFKNMAQLKDSIGKGKEKFENGEYYVIPSKPFTYVKDELIHKYIGMKNNGDNLVQNVGMPLQASKGLQVTKEFENVEIEYFLKDGKKFDPISNPNWQMTDVDNEKVNQSQYSQNAFENAMDKRIGEMAIKEMNENWGVYRGIFMNQPMPIWNCNLFNPSNDYGSGLNDAKVIGQKDMSHNEAAKNGLEGCQLVGIGIGGTFETFESFFDCFLKLVSNKAYIDEKDKEYKEPTAVYIRINGDGVEPDTQDDISQWYTFTVHVS